MARDGRENLRYALERVLWKIQELEATVTNFNGNHELLHSRLNEYVEELRHLQQQRDAADYPVPVDLLRWVDGGGNPDAYTSALFQRTLAANQVAKGKVEALRQFRGELLKQAEAAYPQETAAYQELASGEEVQRLQQAASQSVGRATTVVTTNTTDSAMSSDQATVT